MQRPNADVVQVVEQRLRRDGVHDRQRRHTREPGQGGGNGLAPSTAHAREHLRPAPPSLHEREHVAQRELGSGRGEAVGVGYGAQAAQTDDDVRPQSTRGVVHCDVPAAALEHGDEQLDGPLTLAAVAAAVVLGGAGVAAAGATSRVSTGVLWVIGCVIQRHIVQRHDTIFGIIVHLPFASTARSASTTVPSLADSGHDATCRQIHNGQVAATVVAAVAGASSCDRVQSLHDEERDVRRRGRHVHWRVRHRVHEHGRRQLVQQAQRVVPRLRLLGDGVGGDGGEGPQRGEHARDVLGRDRGRELQAAVDELRGRGEQRLYLAVDVLLQVQHRLLGVPDLIRRREGEWWTKQGQGMTLWPRV